MDYIDNRIHRGDIPKQNFVVYANTSIVVRLNVVAQSAEEALEKGQQIFDKMTDQEIISMGFIGAPLDGVFLVEDLDGIVLLERS